MEKAAKTSKAIIKPATKKVTTVKAIESKSIGTEISNLATEIVAEVKEATADIKDVVVETVNEITETVDFSENVEKIKESMNLINVQLKNSAIEISGEVKEMGSEIKAVATKGIKEISKKVNLNEGKKQVKAVAKKVNTQIAETTKTVKAQINENTEEFKKTATKLANEVVENLHVSDRLNTLKDAVKNSNNYALETTSNMIDNLETNGLKWQGVAKKAVGTGLKLAENQQDLMFSTLEAVKTQIGSTTVRFKKLFSVK